MKKENLEHSRVKVTFDVTPEEFEKALDVAFKKNNENVTIKGFRKGHAPREVFEKNYGVESLYADALDVIFNNKVKELYEDKELVQSICGQFEPVVEGEEKIERGKPFEVSLRFDVYPEFNLPTYKGIEVKKADTEVTDKDVTEAIDAFRSQRAEKKAKAEQVIALNDIAQFDFEGFVDGKAFEGGAAKGYELKIGSHQFIPGFEEQMVGMKAGETKDVIVTFPENYGAKELAGKEAKFVVTVHEVKEEVLPELTDEFVKSLNIENVNTVEEMKAHKLEDLKNRKAQAEKDRQLDEIINNILDNTVIDMPVALEEERINQMRNQYVSQAKMYNIPFEQFLQLMGTDKEKFEEYTSTQGKRQALFNVVVSKIIEEENLTPSKEEIEAKLAEKKIDVKKATQQQYASIYSELAYAKLVDMLLANAKMI